MTVSIGAKLDSGFEDPIGMLTDCHRRIQRFLFVLVTVFERAKDRSLTFDEILPLKSALRYFREGGQRHTADEEESLFPRLFAVGDTSTCDAIRSLEGEHEDAARLHEIVEAALEDWIAGGAVLSASSKDRLAQSLKRLQELYDAHIHFEEGTVFPRAQELLDQDAIRVIGDEFRLRRV